jgi:hypothetical protein
LQLHAKKSEEYSDAPILGEIKELSSKTAEPKK